MPNEHPYQKPESKPIQPALELTNPIRAASEIFYKPQQVFDTLAIKDNWSWIPFLLLALIAGIPSYLYFGIVDFDFYLNAVVVPKLEDMAPAQQEAILGVYFPLQMQIISVLWIAFHLIIINIIMAFYYAMATKNDPKNVQGFTDWYGAMWWIAMPMLVNALLALVLLTFQENGADINFALTNPLSLAYIFGVDMSSNVFDLLNGLRLDSIWAIYLGAVCLMSWTNFSRNKAILIASIPHLFLFGVTIVISSV